MDDKHFSLIVGATKLPLSLIGKPSLFCLADGELQVIDIRNGKPMMAGKLNSFSFQRVKTSMIKMTNAEGDKLYIFGTSSGLKNKAEKAVATLDLPPLVGFTKKAELLPDAFDMASQQTSASGNITVLLPKLLEANGISVKS
jgi:hypothetical protein